MKPERIEPEPDQGPLIRPFCEEPDEDLAEEFMKMWTHDLGGEC